MITEARSRATRPETSRTPRRPRVQDTTRPPRPSKGITRELRAAFRRAFRDTGGPAPQDGGVFADVVASPLGPLLIAANPLGVCMLEFADAPNLAASARRLRERFGGPVRAGTNEHLDRLRDELDGYFAGTLRRFMVPLELRGTRFQSEVWAALLKIPYGQTRSYEELAQRAGRPGAQRAAGLANGRNPIAIVVPCHRVINKSGSLGGYGGQTWRKAFLLDLERRRKADATASC